jgi:hypothetical protein
METYLDINYHLDAKDHPIICEHTDNVSLHLPGYSGDGRGFSIHFVPEHLPLIAELYHVLARLPRQFPPPMLTLDLDPAAESPPRPDTWAPILDPFSPEPAPRNRLDRDDQGG